MKSNGHGPSSREVYRLAPSSAHICINPEGWLSKLFFHQTKLGTTPPPIYEVSFHGDSEVLFITTVWRCPMVPEKCQPLQAEEEAAHLAGQLWATLGLAIPESTDKAVHANFQSLSGTSLTSGRGERGFAAAPELLRPAPVHLPLPQSNIADYRA